MTFLAAISYTPLVRIDLGPLAISPHGIFTAVGFLIGARFLLVDTKKRNISDDLMYSVLTRAAIGALIGARAVYVINNFSNFDSPVEWFKVWEGGISLLGGITGALLAATPLVKQAGLGFFELMDLAAPWLPLGIAVGRIGDIVIADHLGEPTTLPFGFQCPDVIDVGRTVGSRCPAGEVVHLTAAYDLVIAAVVAIVLIALRRVSLRRGERTLLLGVLYGAGRLTFDFLREDVRRFGLTGSQWFAIVVILGCLALLVRRRRRSDIPLVVTGDPAAQQPRLSELTP